MGGMGLNRGVVVAKECVGPMDLNNSDKTT